MKAINRSTIVTFVLLMTSFSSINVAAKTAVEIFNKVSPSVVVVRVYNEKGRCFAFGSGVVLPGGDVATNYHVVEKAASIKVRKGGKDYPALIRYGDRDRDVCTLSVSGIKSPAVPVGSTKNLKVGSRVYAIGTPEGLELTLSEGIISGLRSVEGGQYLQITAPISHGSSGGGLFDEQGRLIGLTTSSKAEGQQLNFAVPVEWIGELSTKNKKGVQTEETYVAWLNKAILLEEKKDWVGLINHAIHLTDKFPQSAIAWYDLGHAYTLSGQDAKSIEAYQQALRIDPEYAEAWYSLGYSYLLSGQFAKSIEASQQAVRINPEYANAWNNLGVAYGKSGLTAKEIEAYQQALRIDQDQVNAWHNLGVAYGKSGQFAKSIEASQQAVRINPEFAEAWNNLGKGYMHTRQSAKSIEASQQAVRINPEFAEAWNNLGIGYFLSGQTVKAMQACQQALRINPEFAEAWYEVGLVYAWSGQWGKVAEVYDRLMTLDPAWAEKFKNGAAQFRR